MIKKYILFLVLFLASLTGLKAQTWVVVGNTLQRTPTAKGYIYRFSLGAPGFWAVAGQSYVDSLFNLAALKTNTITVNGNTQTVGSNPSFTVTTNPGTVTSITPGIGFTNHTPITSSGTLNIDTVTSHTGLANKDYVLQQVLSNSPTIPAGPISSLPVLAFNPGTNISPGAWIQAVYYQSQPPTASLTGGGNLELTSASTATSNLNYSYGKQAATQNLASAAINGSQTGITQNINGASGTVSKTYTTNTTTTYTLLVTTTDSKTASSSTSFQYFGKLYYGYASTSTATNSELLASSGGGNQLISGFAGTYTITASGSNYPFIAYPAIFADITKIVVGGLDVTTAYTKVVRSFTNASGYVQNYKIYTQNTATAGNVTATIN